ncbi:MAG: GatB/YqeY domain-containing protein [Anaerolineae bacterium]|nr:GatB/YqeY domain-containing protein [Anaerolineae bacterium]
MHPKEQIQEDLKAAMKAGDAVKRDALRMLAAALKQEEIDKRITLTEEQAHAILMTEAKKRRDTIAEMTKAGRMDIADKEQMELGLIESYLPTQLTRDEIEAEVRKAMTETGASSGKDMGSLMKVLMPRVKGRADGKLVNEVVKSLLN